MNIDNKNNCSEIQFDQADKIKLKTVTLWGTKEGLFEFFEKRKMQKNYRIFQRRKQNW